jgi:ribosome-associated protein
MLVVMDEGLRVAPGVMIPRSELAWRFSHSGGPGGQSVNTTDSRVELIFNLAASTAFPEFLRARAERRLASRLVNGTLTVVACRERSQLRNRGAAEDRLVELLTQAIAPPPPVRRATRPSRGAVRARLDGKRRRSQLKRNRRPPEQ